MSEEINDIYVKAFNQAYLLSKYNSELIEKILESKNEGIFFEGFEDGRKTYKKEISQSRSNELRKLQDEKQQNRKLER